MKSNWKLTKTQLKFFNKLLITFTIILFSWSSDFSITSISQNKLLHIYNLFSPSTITQVITDLTEIIIVLLSQLCKAWWNSFSTELRSLFNFSTSLYCGSVFTHTHTQNVNSKLKGNSIINYSNITIKIKVTF